MVMLIDKNTSTILNTRHKNGMKTYSTDKRETGANLSLELNVCFQMNQCLFHCPAILP